nr:MAG TPA: hypothetical protein [Caudoviricetes sp.]
MKTVMIANIIIRSVFFICVTVAAIMFSNPTILCWYVLGIFLGFEYKEK